MGDGATGAPVTARRSVAVRITRMEAAHLVGLVRQLRELVADSMDSADTAPTDAAVARLVPQAYTDDADAAREFRSLTAGDLLHRRDDDARVVAAALEDVASASLDDDDALRTRTLTLSADELEAWLRTLTALRLVLASRLHITSENDHDDDDPRFGVYEWLGYRLEGLVQAADDAGL